MAVDDKLLHLLESGAVEAAKGLLGWRFYAMDENGDLVGGTITETEAYTRDDAASHSYKGASPRNQIMFGPAGRLYVYFTYGMHWCVNIVTGKEGEGEAVLLRSIRPDKGLSVIRERRNGRPDIELTNGPAKLCQALNITLFDNGAIINDGLFVMPPPNRQVNYKSTERIGIRHDTHRLWRFIAIE